MRRSLKQGGLRFEKFGELDKSLHSLPWQSTAFMDYDSSEDVPTVPKVYAVARIINLHPLAVCYQRTRRGWHIIVSFSETFSDVELIAIQGILEDDPMRGALNFMRYWNSKGKVVPEFWKKRSNILYKRKVQ